MRQFEYSTMHIIFTVSPQLMCPKWERKAHHLRSNARFTPEKTRVRGNQPFPSASLPPPGVSATATPASAPRASRGGCSASASIIQRGTTARDVTPSTRTGPGPGPPGTPPTSAWVSSCHDQNATSSGEVELAPQNPSGNIKLPETLICRQRTDRWIRQLDVWTHPVVSIYGH